MKKIFLVLLLQQFSFGYAQNLQISISNTSKYSVPDQILGVNTENTFPYKDNSWRRWLEPSTNYNTFMPNFTSTVSNLGFKSFYFPGGSVARVYHYSPTGHGYCLKLNEALTMDSNYNNNYHGTGIMVPNHENENQYYWENNTSFNSTHPLPPPYVEKHRDLCQLNSSTTVVSVNVLWSNPSELKSILDAFINNGVPVAAIIMGTEVDNPVDAPLLPDASAGYNNKIDPFISMLTDPFNPLHEEAFSSIPIAVNAAGEAAYTAAIWNQSVSSHLASKGLPKTGAINWWWYPAKCANAMGDPKSCFDIYFEDSLPARVAHFKAYYDQMYAVQYGIKPDISFDYSNTFINELFPLKDLLWMVDYNAVNGEFFKGAYFFKLGTSASYDPIWDDTHTHAVEMNHSSSYDAFTLAKEIAGKKYIHTTLTPQGGNTIHSESYFFQDSVSGTGKLFILNSSGVADTLHKLDFECQLTTGQITVRSTSAAALLTPKSSMNALTTSTQTSATGSYNIVVPGYSIIVVDFILPISSVTVTANPTSICEGSSSLLSATGAATYSWSTSAGLSSSTGSSVTANPLSTTTYTVTATNSSGCTVTKSVKLIVGVKPVITGDSVICAGTSSSFDVGAGYANYQWSTGATTQTISVDIAGTYDVTVTAVTGFIASESRQLTVTASPTILASPASLNICPGDSIRLTASGGSTYSWETSTDSSISTDSTLSANPAVTTSYTVTGTSPSGCSATSLVTATVSFPLPTDLSTTDITSNSAMTHWTSVSCGSGYKVSYREHSVKAWIRKKIVSNTNQFEISGLLPGIVYDWRVSTKRTDGTYTKFTKKIDFTTLAARIGSDNNGQDSKNNISIFPNPTTGAFSIALDLNEDLTGAATITILNAMGLVVSKQISTAGSGVLEQQILLDKKLPAGFYFINVNISDALYSGKLFFQK